MRKSLFLMLPLLAASFTACQSNRSAADREAQKAQQEANKAEEQARDYRQQAQDLERKAADEERRAAAARSRAEGTAQNAANQAPATAENNPDLGVNQPPTRKPSPSANERFGQTTERNRMSTNRNPVTAAAPVRRNAEIPAGAVLKVRLDQSLDTDTNKGGDHFTATLAEPVVVNGRAVIPRGTKFNGTVTTAESSGRLSGQAALTVKLDSFELNGKTHKINSTTVSRLSSGHTKRDIGIIGGTSGVGAAIGAIAGGGKGAAIGAAAGAAAGTAGAAATGKQDVKLPAETMMVFTLQSPITL